MKRYRVIIPPSVERQILEHLLYIARDSVDHALTWERRLRAAIAHLADGPGFAIDPRASARMGEPIHRYVFERTYLVHYRVDRDRRRIELLNFRHGARLPDVEEP